VVISLLVGSSVAMAGSISFVGLIIPHITRLIFGPEHRRLLFFSVLNGMSLILFADLLARTVRSPLEIQVGVLIALVGAPFFFWLLWRKEEELHV
jgi:iron complex transport system permease protein